MPFLPSSSVWLRIKIVAVMTVTMWFRGTFPRLRVDKLMEHRLEVAHPGGARQRDAVGALALLLPQIY